MGSQGRQQAPLDTSTSTATPTVGTSPTTGEVPDSNAAAIERLSSGRAHWESAFGERIGGLLWEVVEDNVNDEKIDELLADGGKDIADWIYEQLLDHADEQDLDRIRELRPHLRDAIQTGVVAPLQEGGLGPSVESWVATHPYETAGLGVLGAAGFIASNPELDGDLSHRLNDNHKLSFGGSFGNLFSPELQSLRAGYEYSDSDTKLSLEGEQWFDRDQWSLSGAFAQQTDYGQLTGYGSYLEHAEGYNATGGLGFTAPDWRARLDGSYDSQADLGRLTGDFRTTHESGPNWTAGFDANTEGAWNANVGVSEQRDNWEWFLKAGAGQDMHGNTDVNAMGGVAIKF